MGCDGTTTRFWTDATADERGVVASSTAASAT
jgi:hypothetical protein